MSRHSSRRTFIKNTSAIGAALFVGGALDLRGQERSANEQLNVASFGVGGKGGSDSSNAAKENLTLSCWLTGLNSTCASPKLSIVGACASSITSVHRFGHGVRIASDRSVATLIYCFR